MSASLLRRRGNRIILAALVASVGACSNSIQDLEKQEAAQRSADMAVSVLPPGVEDAWNVYLDQQFARAVQPQGDVVRLTDTINVLDATSLVSRNSPYEVHCDSTGGSINFGQGESATTVTIYGIGAEPPPLGVPTNSIAAKHLYQEMCERIAAHMHDVMQVAR